jgi:hypothetical protein
MDSILQESVVTVDFCLSEDKFYGITKIFVMHFAALSC